MPELNVDTFYLIGRWIGDGWVRDGQRSNRPEGQHSGTIIICAGKKREDSLRSAVERVFDKYHIEQCRTANKYIFTSRLFSEWIVDNFGKYAHGKFIPSWAFGMRSELREALLRGILESDGHEYSEGNYKVTSVSRKLVEGIRLLSETLGFSTTTLFTERPKTTAIEGRTVNQRDTYTLVITKGKVRKTLKSNLHSWYLVRRIEPQDTVKRVYNISVESDNSYVANGIVVHNCQSMSVAGKREGLKHESQGDEETTRSGMFFEAIRIMTEMREETNGQYPRFAVWENVPGAFSSGGGRDFLAVLQAIAAIAEPGVSIPEPERDSKTDNLIWFSAGSIVGNGWSIAWRTLDAQYWGVPQRRKRIYLVADFGSERAADILLERYSLRGNIAESGEARKRIAEDATGCADGSIGVECLNPLFFDAYNQLSGDVSKTLNTGSDYDKTGCVVQPVIALQANGIDRADTAGCNGAGWRENEMYTLNTVDRHAVCYPLNEQIILRHGALGKNTGFGAGDDGDPAYTLQANHPHMVCYQESVGALQASDYKWVQQQQVEQGKLIVTNRDKDKRYIVRRLMPIETTRLQGYPDFWHHLAPFDGDVEFWESVRKTWARINGTTYKPFKDIARLEKWYYKLRNDGAEYKADGNSLAIPCAEYVIRRIAETVLEESNQNIDKQQ